LKPIIAIFTGAGLDREAPIKNFVQYPGYTITTLGVEFAYDSFVEITLQSELRTVSERRFLMK